MFGSMTLRRIALAMSGLTFGTIGVIGMFLPVQVARVYGLSLVDGSPRPTMRAAFRTTASRRSSTPSCLWPALSSQLHRHAAVAFGVLRAAFSRAVPPGERSSSAHTARERRHVRDRGLGIEPPLLDGRVRALGGGEARGIDDPIRSRRDRRLGHGRRRGGWRKERPEDRLREGSGSHGSGGGRSRRRGSRRRRLHAGAERRKRRAARDTTLTGSDVLRLERARGFDATHEETKRALAGARAA